MLHFLPVSILAQIMLMSSTSVSLSLPRSQMMRMDLPELIVLDVGHGNCALVRDIHGTIIIDCPLGSTLMKTLRQLNIREIASVLLSHADEDHIGGVMNLLTNEDITVQHVFLNADALRKTLTWKNLRQALADVRK